MKRMRGGSGLGDSIYMRSVASYFLKQGEQLQVCTNYPDVFDGMPVSIAEFSRTNIQILAHYSSRKSEPTNQWQDICITARIPEEIEQNIEWSVKNHALVDKIKAAADGRKIIIVCAPHAPMGRTDGFGREILPSQKVFSDVLSGFDDCYRVLIGGENPVYPVPHDCNMVRQTSITELFDIATIANGMIGQCSFVIPLAEGFHKPLLTIWSHAVQSAHVYVRQITPQKILAGRESMSIMDDWDDQRIKEVAREFRQRLA